MTDELLLAEDVDVEAPAALLDTLDPETLTDAADAVASIVSDAMTDPGLFLDTVFAPFGGE